MSGPPTPDRAGLENYKFSFESIPSSTTDRPKDADADDQSRGSESLGDSVTDFPELFGRTYHAFQAGAYLVPNDGQEQDRMEFQNEILFNKVHEGKLFFAPFSKQNPPRRVLDVATGIGDWAIQMGDRFPSAYVEGIDLSPIQPNKVPPNVRFYIQDAREPWNPQEPFDFIHVRSTAGSFSDYKTQIIQQAYENLAPGGWLECSDGMAAWNSDDGTLNPDGALCRWTDDIHRAHRALGNQFTMADKYVSWFKEAGFVDVQEKVFKMPLNGWPEDPRLKAIGQAWMRNFLAALSSWSLAVFHTAFGWTEERIQVDLADVRREIQDTSIHVYHHYHVVWGRKPLTEEASGHQE